jgi:hypothetical protein
VSERWCGCGCGASLVGRRVNVRYADPRHRQRAYRKRLLADLEAAGISALLSRSGVRSATGTNNRNGDGPVKRQGAKRRRAPDPRVDYRPLLELLAGAEEIKSRERALEIIRPGLPPRLRGEA